MPPILQRMTAWLCLAVALFTGVAPVQNLVLCIEGDGCVQIEVRSSDAGCDSCAGHEASTSSSQTLTAMDRVTGCPCIDLAVPRVSKEQRVLPRPIELQVGAWVALPPAPIPQLPVSVAGAVRASPVAVPRPPDSLALIRTVVLLV